MTKLKSDMHLWNNFIEWCKEHNFDPSNGWVVRFYRNYVLKDSDKNE